MDHLKSKKYGTKSLYLYVQNQIILQKNEVSSDYFYNKIVIEAHLNAPFGDFTTIFPSMWLIAFMEIDKIRCFWIYLINILFQQEFSTS